MTSSTPRFHPPQQSRSQETLGRILDAAERVLEEKSFGDATLAEIMERAGVTVGAFYRRFPDKDALLHHLDDRFFTELRGHADELLDPGRWERASFAQVIPQLARIAVPLFRMRRGLLRTIFIRARTDAKIQATARELNGLFLAKLRVLADTRLAEIVHPVPHAAVDLGFRILVGALRETVVFGEVWPDAPAMTDEQLAHELARSYLAYLGVASPLHIPRHDTNQAD
ncbi:MAG: TetR/AcrR family transcriptional regulator [Gemmatimonadaceae bacterium]|nr:TetR/AcrR family transcriptional regulator [Gemmatimonadaceae bacterium]